VVGALLFLGALSIMNRPAAGKQLSLTDLLAAIKNGDVRDAEIFEGDQAVRGTLTDGTAYEARYPAEFADELTTKLEEADVPTQTNPQKPNAIVGLLYYVLPILILAGLFLWMMNRAQGGGGRVMQFGRSRHKQVTKD
jgi:cell division protease FtsH